MTKTKDEIMTVGKKRYGFKLIFPFMESHSKDISENIDI
jgi:hypothetical protein